MDLDVLLLDDSYQHRRIKPGFNILLTDYNDPYFKDFVLPAGNLRESRRGAKRADIIVVTKCPENITEEKNNSIFLELNLDITKKCSSRPSIMMKKFSVLTQN